MKKTEIKNEKPRHSDGPPRSAEPQEPLVAVERITVPAQELEELKERATKAEENWERLLRTTADFENFKKRATREKQEAIKFGNESLLQKLVPVLDHFDMAITAAQAGGSDAAKPLQDGIQMVYQQLKNALVEAGLEEIDAAGKPFDPNLHEAVAQSETADVPEGQVVQQLRKGYKLRERLLRPASVVVAKRPAA